MPSNSPKTFRVHGLSIGIDQNQAQHLLEAVLCHEEGVRVRVRSLAPDLGHFEMVATVEINPLPRALQDSARDRWRYTLEDEQGSQGTTGDIELTLDTHFRGLTPIFTPASHEPRVSIIALSGLGGHAFGSFKDRDSSYMWLRDWLPLQSNFANIYLHGYDSRLSNSNSFQSIRDLGTTLRHNIQHVLSRQQAIHASQPDSQPAEFVVLLGHSLGGIIIKEALIQIAEGPRRDRALLQRIYGLILFGVPNRGMRIESLRAMAGNGPNRSLLETLGPESEVLRQQAQRFPRYFNDHDSEVLCFYETEQSPTARQMSDGSFTMNGDPEIMVGSDSATHVRPWEEEEKAIIAVSRTHSGMVKFPRHDHNGRMVVQCVTEMCRRASERSQRGILHHGTANLPITRRIDDNLAAITPALPPRNPTTDASQVPPSNLRNPNEPGANVPAFDADMQVFINRQMIEATGAGNLPKVKDLLQSGADINSSDGHKWAPTALAFAAACYKINKDTIDRFPAANHPSIHANLRTYAEIIRYLTDNGASWDRETPDTKLLIRHALQNSK